MFNRGVFELDLRNRDQLEWLGNGHSGNLRINLLGEEDALLDRFSGEIRPSVGIRMFLNNLPPPSHFLRPVDRGVATGSKWLERGARALCAWSAEMRAHP
jgi:hypothetical protein